MRKTIYVALSLVTALATVPALAKTTHKAGTKAMSAQGTLEAYDAASHKLTLKTKTGNEIFVVSDNTKLFEGSGKTEKTLALSTLGSETGDHAVVKFTEENGEKTVKSVHLNEPATKTTPAAKKTTPTSSKKY